MCAIIDADVVAEAFGRNQTPAGQAFRYSVDCQGLRLIAGGELLDALDKHQNFRTWRAVARQYGRVQIIGRGIVEPLANQLRSSNSCVSNDAHVIALAQVSGARLLFSNDKPLHQDFKDKRLIDDPRGKVFSTNEDRSVTRTHRRLLNDSSLCIVGAVGSD